jgi:hypothetical protein
MGPAMPISKSAILLGMRDRSLMNAPSVPVSGSGAGRKYGRVASTL